MTLRACGRLSGLIEGGWKKVDYFLIDVERKKMKKTIELLISKEIIEKQSE